MHHELYLYPSALASIVHLHPSAASAKQHALHHELYLHTSASAPDHDPVPNIDLYSSSPSSTPSLLQHDDSLHNDAAATSTYLLSTYLLSTAATTTTSLFQYDDLPDYHNNLHH